MQLLELELLVSQTQNQNKKNLNYIAGSLPDMQPLMVWYGCIYELVQGSSDHLSKVTNKSSK